MNAAHSESLNGLHANLVHEPAASNRWRRRATSFVGVAVLAGGLAACGSSASTSSSLPSCASGAPKITVEADGQASVAPDTLTVDVGINVTDATASAALADANNQATTLIGALKGSGVVPSDIQSTGFSINPNYSTSGAITGYQVSNTLLVTLHDLSNAGQVIDTAAASVGNDIRIDGLSFSVEHTGKVDGEARAAAVTLAHAHARSMAQAAGDSLGGICSISDSTLSPSADSLQASAGYAAAKSSAAVPLEAGTQQADAQVSIIYLIAPK
jgi:uncharacterized protein YggE